LTKSSPYTLLFTRSSSHHATPIFDEDDWWDANDYTKWSSKHHSDLLEWNNRQKRVLEDIYPEIKEQTTKKRRKAALTFEATHRIVPPLKVGTIVMACNAKKGAKYGDQKWVGPYKIIEINPTGSYIIEDSEGDKFRRNVSQLKVVKQKNKQTERNTDSARVIHCRENTRTPKTGTESEVPCKMERLSPRPKLMGTSTRLRRRRDNHRVLGEISTQKVNKEKKNQIFK